MLRVLLTNDDGLGATGLQTLRRALLGVKDVELAVIAPDSNRSATARSITFSRPLWVTEVKFDDGTLGYACDGTPVDCVRLASLGLIEGFEPDLIVAGINHGSNLGDDITYSGTVAAALEGVVLGVPGIAVSQQSLAREMDFRLGERFDFEAAAAFTAQHRGPARRRAAPRGDAAQHQRPGRASGRGRGRAARQAHLQGRAEGRRGGGRPQALPHLRRLARARRRGREPTWRRCRRAACRSRRCTST